eukprot:scpid85254/ scgid5363/ 
MATLSGPHAQLLRRLSMKLQKMDVDDKVLEYLVQVNLVSQSTERQINDIKYSDRKAYHLVTEVLPRSGKNALIYFVKGLRLCERNSVNYQLAREITDLLPPSDQEAIENVLVEFRWITDRETPDRVMQLLKPGQGHETEGIKLQREERGLYCSELCSLASGRYDGWSVKTEVGTASPVESFDLSHEVPIVVLEKEGRSTEKVPMTPVQATPDDQKQFPPIEWVDFRTPRGLTNMERKEKFKSLRQYLAETESGVCDFGDYLMADCKDFPNGPKAVCYVQSTKMKAKCCLAVTSTDFKYFSDRQTGGDIHY